jgi:hypothetical protein
MGKDVEGSGRDLIWGNFVSSIMLLFSDPVGLVCVASNGMMVASNEWVRMWKEVAVTSFGIILRKTTSG